VPAGVKLDTFTFPEASTVMFGSVLVLLPSAISVKFTSSIVAGVFPFKSLLNILPTNPKVLHPILLYVSSFAITGEITVTVTIAVSQFPKSAFSQMCKFHLAYLARHLQIRQDLMLMNLLGREQQLLM